MRQLRAWFLRLQGFLAKDRRERELAEELESHLQMHIEDNLRSGMGPEEARRRALLKLGGMEQTKELYRDQCSVPLLETLFLDIRHAMRSLPARRLYTFASILTLGLGVGAATAMFSVVDGVLLKPLPYNEPGRLVAVWQTRPSLEGMPGDDGRRWDRYRPTYLQYRDLSEKSTFYEGLAAYRAGTSDVATLTGIGDPIELRAGAATASLLPLLGVRPVLGRWFLPGEEASRAGDNGASITVVSHEFWQDRLGGVPEALGRIVTIDDHSFTIVGILPPDFQIHWLSASFSGESDPGKRDVWFPIGAPGWEGKRNAYSWETVGRLAPGATLEQARVESQTIMSAHSDTEGEVRVIPRMAEETYGLTSPLVLLFGASALLLLIACGNVAALSMAEILSRQHEIATRSALGASVLRIMRLLLTESFVLAALGSAVGAVLALAVTRVLVALAPPIPRIQEVAVDLRILGFAALAGACSALILGMAPLVVSFRSIARPFLRVSGSTGFNRRGLFLTVTAMEIAITAMLLIAGGLLTRSLTQLLAVDPGFDARDLVTVEVSLPLTRYPARETRVVFFQDVLSRLEAIPGIGMVSGVSRLPFPGHTSGWRIRIEGRDQHYSPLGYQVAPRYLKTLGVPLLAGRSLDEADGPGAPLAVVINETMARRYWPDESPLGARFHWGGSDELVTVVGIVGDVTRQTLRANIEPAFFIPFSQHPDESVCFVARTRLEPRDAIRFMREAVWSVDAKLPVKNATTIAALIEQSAYRERYVTLLVSAFGILASLLAAAGIFGVTARSVASRKREMGIRMAFGARESGLIGTTVRSSLLTGLAGAAVGLLGALWTSRLLSRFLFGIEPDDPITYALVAAFIIVVCLLASLLAASRITSVNPVDVLRAE